MLILLLTLCLQSELPTFEVPRPASAASAAEDPKEEYKRRRDEAGEDVAKLWELYEWCEAFGLDKEGRSCLRAIIKEDKDHEQARKALGHIYYDGQWFTTQKKLDAYKKKEEKRRAEEEGLVKYEGEWVKAEDLPFLKKGMVRNEDGEWIDAEQAKREAEGWIQQDLTWVPPSDKEKIDQGLWKCDDKWLPLEEANKFHSKLNSWWTIPTDYFVVYTTCDRDVAMKAADEMARAFRELSRIYGSSPADKIPVVVMRSQAQYSQLAGGINGQRNPTESHGLSSIHYAYFADVLFVQGERDSIEWLRSGVGFWDPSAENGDAFGPHSVRHAAGQSFAEAMDPSPKTVAKFDAEGPTSIEIDDFYDEKNVPEWFRSGAVTYAERYFVDNLVRAGGNANWAREWSIQNILNKGGLRSVSDIIDGRLTSDNVDDSAKLLNERGLLIAFMIDGDNVDVKQAHGAVKAALKKGENGKAEFKALAKALEKAEGELRKFAGI